MFQWYGLVGQWADFLGRRLILPALHMEVLRLLQDLQRSLVGSSQR
jgi:hypothetical protein